MSLLGIRPVSHGRSYKHETAKPTRSRFALIKTTTHSKGSAEFINPALLIHHTCLWARQSNPPICCRSVAQLCPTLCNPMNHSTPGFPVLQHLPIPAQTHVRRVGDATQPSHPLSSPFPPAFNLSQHQGLFQWVSSLHQVAKVLELHFSISPSSEYSGLISFRIDWFDLLAVQGTFKSLLQHHSSKASILQHSAFFMVQHSHPNMTTGKTIALTTWTFVDKVTSLLYNMLSRFVIAFLPRSKCPPISWIQNPVLNFEKIRKPCCTQQVCQLLSLKCKLSLQTIIH